MRNVLLNKIFDLFNAIKKVFDVYSQIIERIKKIKSFKKQIFNKFLKKITELLKKILSVLKKMLRLLSSVFTYQRTEDFYNNFFKTKIYLPSASRLNDTIDMTGFWLYAKNRCMEDNPSLTERDADKIFAYSEVNFFVFVKKKWVFPQSLTVYLENYDEFTVAL